MVHTVHWAGLAVEQAIAGGLEKGENGGVECIIISARLDFMMDATARTG